MDGMGAEESGGQKKNIFMYALPAWLLLLLLLLLLLILDRCGKKEKKKFMSGISMTWDRRSDVIN